MGDNDYSKYYWQNDKVRFAPGKFEDWEEHYSDRFDSQARFFLECSLEIPVSEAHDQEMYRNPSVGSENVGFAIQTLNGEVIGGIGLNRVNQRDGTFSIALRINNKHRGKGYGTSALLLMLDYAFNERRLHKFNANIVEGNTASESIVQRIGCVKEGVCREMFFHEGRHWNEVLYGLTAEEYRNRHKNESSIKRGIV